MDRATAEVVLSEARVLRTGTETLPTVEAGEGALAPLDKGVAELVETGWPGVAPFWPDVLGLVARPAGASALLPLAAADEDGLTSLFCRSFRSARLLSTSRSLGDRLDE